MPPAAHCRQRCPPVEPPPTHPTNVPTPDPHATHPPPPQSLSFPDPAPIDLPLGKVVEWSVNHVAVHPLHTHTNPFQLQELLPANLLPGCQYSSWFEVGGHCSVTAQEWRGLLERTSRQNVNS